MRGDSEDPEKHPLVHARVGFPVSDRLRPARLETKLAGTNMLFFLIKKTVSDHGDFLYSHS